MSRLRKPFILISATLLLIAMVIVFHRALDPDRTCLRWTGVRTLKLSGHEAVSCDSLNRLQRPDLPEPMHEWVRRINRLHRLSWLFESSRAVEVDIDPHEPQKFEIDGRRISIGYALAETPMQFEHAILLGWVNLNWPEHDEFTQEVMADLLSWSVLGDSEWHDPTRDETVAPAERLKYALVPESQQTYCESPFRSLQDLEDCRLPQGELPPTKALRPLVSWSLWRFVRELPASLEIQFFHALVNTHFSHLQVANVLTDPQGWARATTKTLLKYWSLESELQRVELKKVFNSVDLVEPLRFDLTVEVSDPELQKRVIASLSKWSKFSPNWHVLYVDRTQKIVFPENVHVDFAANEIETRHHVMLACQWPKPSEAFSPKNHTFSAIRICDDETLPSWRELVSPALAGGPHS